MSNCPHFLIIGAARTGTSWLFKCLSRHPNLWLPPIKELHYFDSIASSLDEGFALQMRRYRLKTFAKARVKSYLKHGSFKPFSGHILRDALAWDWRFFGGNGSLDWYQSLFQPAANHGYITGEATPAYSILPAEDIDTIFSIVPNVKLLLILRDPIERIWSDFGRAKRKYGKSYSDEAKRAYVQSVSHQRRSNFPSILTNWTERTPKGQLWIGFYDDLQADPSLFIDGVSRFLGVTPASQFLKADDLQPANAGTSFAEEMPDWLRRDLYAAYRDDLAFLADRLGGHAAHWQRRAAALDEG